MSTNEATILDSRPEHLPVKSKLIDSLDLENQFTLLANEVARSQEGTAHIASMMASVSC